MNFFIMKAINNIIEIVKIFKKHTIIILTF